MKTFNCFIAVLCLGCGMAVAADTEQDKLCGGLSAELVSSTATVRQSALEKAAVMTDEKDALCACLGKELSPALEPAVPSRLLALDALRRLGRAEDFSGEIMDLFLHSQDTSEAVVAATVLAPYASDLADDYVPALAAQFAGGKPVERRLLSALLLSNMGILSRGAENAVRPLLSDEDPRVRGWAAAVLAGMFPEHPEATSVREIVGLFRYDEKAARQALVQLDPDGGKTVQLLRPVLSDSDSELRAACALVLGEMHDKAKDAVPDLMRMLESADLKVGYAAAQALGSIGPGALPQLLVCIDGEPDIAPARQCAVALSWMGREAIGDLERSLTARGVNVRRNSAAALGMMSGQLLMPQASMFYDDPQGSFDRLRQTLPTLQKAADGDPEQDMRLAAKHAMDEIRRGISVK